MLLKMQNEDAGGRGHENVAEHVVEHHGGMEDGEKDCGRKTVHWAKNYNQDALHLEAMRVMAPL